MPTAKQTAKTLTVGTSAVAFDPGTDLGTNAHAMHRYLRVKNRSSTAEIAVHDGGGTAAIDGDDVVHIPPFGSEIFDVTALSIIASAAATKVEVCGDKGRLR